MPTDNSNPIARQVGQAPTRPINLVVIHCSATPSGKPLQQGTPGAPGYLNAPKVINAWHAARGFKRQAEAVRAFSSQLPSIGYHYVIDLTGEVWSGRALTEVGAHVARYNATSVGICLVGGAEREARYTAKQWKSLQQVVAMLLADYGIPCATPKRLTATSVSAGVCGHRDLSPDLNHNGTAEPNEWLKTCPGFDVSAWLARGMEPLPGQICEVKA
jgi:N-acetyl-anhydromuramyl-L-alanine amidase AmpD